MNAGGASAAGSSRALRLDPFSLPVRFQANDAGADEHVRQVELHRERVVVRRAVGGMRIALSLPVSLFLGVAIRVVPPDGGFDGAVAVMLEHRDRALSVPLFLAFDGDDVVAEWQLWARVLGLPLLISDGDGSFREPFARIGAVRVAEWVPRRRRQTAIKTRRPRILARRKLGCLSITSVVHRGEREIIARN